MVGDRTKASGFAVSDDGTGCTRASGHVFEIRGFEDLEVLDAWWAVDIQLASGYVWPDVSFTESTRRAVLRTYMISGNGGPRVGSLSGHSLHQPIAVVNPKPQKPKP